MIISDKKVIEYSMTRDALTAELVRILKEDFEIDNPELDKPLRETYGFDSIDAIELLTHIEDLLETELTRDEKKLAMEIRTINQICDYIEDLLAARTAAH